MGRKKVVSPVVKVNYPPLHLHSLPYEIIVQIFDNLAGNLQHILALASVCRKFNSIINKNFLYNSLLFHSPAQFLRFAHAHLGQKTSLSLRSHGPSPRINYIRLISFVNPPANDAASKLTQIAGTYLFDCLEEGISVYQNFVTELKNLMNEAYGLKEIRMTEIAPQFAFQPPESSSFSSIKHHFRAPKPTRSLTKLVLSTQSGWNIPFKLSHILLFLEVFDQISELKLNNFILNESKLVAETLPKPVTVDCLVLTSCIYTHSRRSGQKHECAELFVKTTSLLLEKIRNGADLSLIDFIKVNDHLRRLSIDVSSPIFYACDPNDFALKFDFTKFNNFFELVCSGQKGYLGLREVVLTSFDLFNSYSHEHEKTALACIEEEDEDEEEKEEGVRDPWAKKPTNTFDSFLESLSKVEFLTIVVKEAPKVMHTCKNCGFRVEEESKTIASLLPYEWSIILAPILRNPLCSVLIYDHTLQVIFSRAALK